MIRQTIIACSGLVLLMVALAPPGSAEVAVRTDRAGDYVATQVTSRNVEGDPVIWGSNGRGSRRNIVLNPEGDLRGDGWPLVKESIFAPHYPWVVWSRFGAEDYDLAWSRWTTNGWSSISLVSLQSTTGNDIDPELSFDPFGRPFLVWTREENGVGRIYFSVFLVHRWMTGFPISEDGQDSRHPVIVRHGADTLVVEYTTTEGQVRQLVTMSRPVTITDDINPVSFVYLRGKPKYVRDD